MWVWFSVCSAVLLGLYDVAKKESLKRNGVLWILLGTTAITTVLLCPFLTGGSLGDHLSLVVKALLVSSSWVSGLVAMKLLPLTTVSTIKASRPMFVVIFSIILFGERLSPLQWAGVVLVLAALFLLGRSSRKEGISFVSNKGIVWMVVSVLTGAASALYDKHILAHLQPMFVQSWSNLYITAVLAVLISVRYLRDRSGFERFRWDWRLVLIAVLITVSDALYFFAIKDEGALLSVISMIRRSSAVITFLFGAFVFKESHIRGKAVDLVILMGGIALLLFASS